MLYSFLVNIMSLSGTHHKNKPLCIKGLFSFRFSRLYTILYIVDLTAFLSCFLFEIPNKKYRFYTTTFCFSSYLKLNLRLH